MGRLHPGLLSVLPFGVGLRPGGWLACRGLVPCWAAAPRAAARGAVTWGPRPRLPPLPLPPPLSPSCVARACILLEKCDVLPGGWMYVAAGWAWAVQCCTCDEERVGLMRPRVWSGDGVLGVRVGGGLVSLSDFSGRAARASRGLSPCCAAAPRAAAREVVSWGPRPKIPALPLPPSLSPSCVARR